MGVALDGAIVDAEGEGYLLVALAGVYALDYLEFAVREAVSIRKRDARLSRRFLLPLRNADEPHRSERDAYLLELRADRPQEAEGEVETPFDRAESESVHSYGEAPVEEAPIAILE